MKKQPKSGVKQEDIRLVVSMSDDYTTESMNLGKRTFQKDHIYQVCPLTFSELMATGLAEVL